VAGKSTLNRLELSRLEPTRYHKISHNPIAIKRARSALPVPKGLVSESGGIFIDETWTSTSMVRLRGRCPRGG
jgi:hypothetical protein